MRRGELGDGRTPPAHRAWIGSQSGTRTRVMARPATCSASCWRLQDGLAGADEGLRQGELGRAPKIAAAALTARAELASRARRDVDAASELGGGRGGSWPIQPTAGLAAGVAGGAGASARADRAGAGGRLVDAMLEADPLDVRALHERALPRGDGRPGGPARWHADGGSTSPTMRRGPASSTRPSTGLRPRADRATDRSRQRSPCCATRLAWLAGRARRQRGRRRDVRAPGHAPAAAAPAWAMPARARGDRRWLALGHPAGPRRSTRDVLPGQPALRPTALCEGHRPVAPCREAGPGLPDRAPQPRHRRGQRGSVVRSAGLAAYRSSRSPQTQGTRGLLYELDQLRKRLGHEPAGRLRDLRRAAGPRRDSVTT